MYYRLESDEAGMTAYVNAIKESFEDFLSGQLLPIDPEEVFEYSYLETQGAPLFDYYSGDNLMSNRLVESLRKAGVDNLQTFKVKFLDQKTGDYRLDYSLVNVLGLVACADLPSSEHYPLGDRVFFKRLVIDPAKTNGLRLFRLAESTLDIVVHENVVRQIPPEHLTGVLTSPVQTIE